jgi:GAF domain-containing protein
MGARMSVVSAQYENSRLTALERYAVLDSEREAIFDQFAAMTAQLLEAPISIVGMIDQDRHWFKAAQGTPLRSNSRANSFCTYTVQSDHVFTVENALEDSRFANNPVVTGEAHIRAYAGAPLVTRDGFSIGTLCIFDTQTRAFSDHERNTLSRLAAMVMQELENRLERVEPNATPESREVALDRAASTIGLRLGLSVHKLYGSREKLELGAISQEPESLEGVFENLRQNQPETALNANVKLKLLERIRFTRNHNPKPAPARILMLNTEHAIIAHAFDPKLEFQIWTKQPGIAALALASFNGSAFKVPLPKNSTLIGLTNYSASSEPDWLALGELPTVEFNPDELQAR